MNIYERSRTEAERTPEEKKKHLIKYDMIMVNFVNIYAYGFINVVFRKCSQSRTYIYI